jgi:hypothetical protein
MSDGLLITAFASRTEATVKWSVVESTSLTSLAAWAKEAGQVVGGRVEPGETARIGSLVVERRRTEDRERAPVEWTTRDAIDSLPNNPSSGW